MKKELRQMDIGGNEGIAGEFRLLCKEDVLRLTPFSRTYEGCAGHSLDELTVTAILADGSQKELEAEWESAHASNHEPTTGEDAPQIGEQIAGLPVTALIFQRRGISYEGEERTNYEEILYLDPPDYGKIRRRAEDALRKASPDIIFRVAVDLGVKIY